MTPRGEKLADKFLALVGAETLRRLMELEDPADLRQDDFVEKNLKRHTACGGTPEWTSAIIVWKDRVVLIVSTIPREVSADSDIIEVFFAHKDLDVDLSTIEEVEPILNLLAAQAVGDLKLPMPPIHGQN